MPRDLAEVEGRFDVETHPLALARGNECVMVVEDDPAVVRMLVVDVLEGHDMACGK